MFHIPRREQPVQVEEIMLFVNKNRTVNFERILRPHKNFARQFRGCLPSTTSRMVWVACPTELVKMHAYAPPSVRSRRRSWTLFPESRTRSFGVNGRPSLCHDKIGEGVAEASQNMSTVSPSFWIRKVGDTSPRTGGAAIKTRKIFFSTRLRARVKRLSTGNVFWDFPAADTFMNG